MGEKKKKINYQFIPTSLFCGRPLIRGFNQNKLYHPYIQYSLSNLCRAKLTAWLLRRRVLFLWRQEDTSSLCLFSVDNSGWQMIRNFSLGQRLHLLLELFYGECDERMPQEIKWSMLLSLRVQICLMSLVEFLCLAWRNDAVWFLYLVLKLLSVSPMYVSVVLLSLRVTVAW